MATLETPLLVVAGVVAAFFLGALLFYLWSLRRLRKTNSAVEARLHEDQGLYDRRHQEDSVPRAKEAKADVSPAIPPYHPPPAPASPRVPHTLLHPDAAEVHDDGGGMPAHWSSIQGFASPGSRASKAFSNGGLTRWSTQGDAEDKFGDNLYTPDAVATGSGTAETSFGAQGSSDPTLGPYSASHPDGAVVSNPLFGMEEEDLQAALSPSPPPGSPSPPGTPQPPSPAPEAGTMWAAGQPAAATTSETAAIARRRSSKGWARAPKRTSFRSSGVSSQLNDVYPGSDVPRCYVAFRDWESPDPSYLPPVHTSEEVLAGGPGIDRGLLASRKRPPRFNANDSGESPSVDRTSFTGFYKVVDGKPRNPRERTGLEGRGCLGRWGPNHVTHAVVTRWAFTEMGEPVYRDGHRVLQVLCQAASYSSLPSLPEMPRQSGQTAAVPPNVVAAFGDDAMQAAQLDAAEMRSVKSAVKTVFGNGVGLYKGYLGDPRNTDNAWVETLAHLYHDDTGAALGHFSLQTFRPDATMRWEVVHQELQMYGGQGMLLEAVSQRLNSFWRAGDAPMVDLPHQPPVTNNMVYVPKAPGAPPSEAASVSGRRPEEEGVELIASQLGSVAATPRASSPALSQGARAPPGDPAPADDPTPTAMSAEAQKVAKELSDEAGDGRVSPAPDAVPDTAKMNTLKRRASYHASAVASGPPAPLARRRSSKLRAIDSSARGADPDGVIGVFNVELVGAVSTTNPGGSDVVSACIKALKKRGKKEHTRVQLVISGDGITIEKPNDVMQKNDIIQKVPIRQISFSHVDPANKKTFAFVTNNPKTQAMLCYIFNCKQKAKPVADAVTQAFEKAAQLRSDPFAIDRSMPVTPGAEDEFSFEHRFPRHLLKVQMIIGHGQYGKVYLAEHAGVGNSSANYAVKLMRPKMGHVDAAEFVAEADMLKALDHPNCLSLIGVCLEKLPWLIVLEFMQYKDLGVVLRQCKKNAIWLRSHEQLNFIRQVNEGLLYLGSIRMIHRDIAARNVMLDHDNVVKIGDFGLTRKLPDGQDWWKLDKSGRLPVKYLSYEALTLKRFSTASDVWAFGVFIWEIISYAANPWEAEGIKTVDIRQAVLDGRRLSPAKHVIADAETLAPAAIKRIESVYAQIHSMAETCWLKEPEDRPTAADLKRKISALMNEEVANLPPIRDVGKLCFDRLEQQRSSRRKIGQRGGSVIKAGRASSTKGTEHTLSE